MDNEEFLNILRQVNTLLDVQLSRLDSIERMNPKQSVYLKQMHKAFFKGECCAPCYVIPSESDCTGGTGTGTGGGTGGGIVIDASNATSHIAIGFVYSLGQYFSGAIKIVEQNLDGSYETLMAYIAAEDATVQNFVDTLPQFISDLTIEEMALPNGNPAIHLINGSSTNRKFFIVTTNLSGSPFNNWGPFSNNYSMSEDIQNNIDTALYAHTTYNVGVHYSFVLAAM